MRACGLKTQRVFSPQHPSIPKSHRPFFLPSLLHEECHSPSYWGCGGVWTPSLCKIPCLVAPAFSLDSLTPAAVKRSAYGPQDSCAWRGNCFGCFLASQGPLPTLILGLCSSPWVPAIILCMELLHEGRRKDREETPPGYPHQLNMGD